MLLSLTPVPVDERKELMTTSDMLDKILKGDGESILEVSQYIFYMQMTLYADTHAGIIYDRRCRTIIFYDSILFYTCSASLKLYVLYRRPSYIIIVLNLLWYGPYGL